MCTHNQILANGFKLTNTTNISRSDRPQCTIAVVVVAVIVVVDEIDIDVGIWGTKMVGQ